MDEKKRITIVTLSAKDVEDRISELGRLLHVCVKDGASISFVMPFSEVESEAFWIDKVLPAVRGEQRVLLVAYTRGVLVGSVQLDCDTPPNQPHRAEVAKLLVHPSFRRLGIARALMAELERLACGLGRSLITLDTRTGDSAEPLYASLGYETAGVIPGYAMDPVEKRLDSTTVMYKVLAGVAN